MKISIVVPVYQEEKSVLPLYQRLQEVTSGLTAVQWDYIFVNDGGLDRSLDILKELASKDSRVKVLDLSKNFGKEAALSAGVHAAEADAVICMDADLQHPPSLIPRLVEEWRRGAEIVVGIRDSIEGQPFFRRVGSFLYYRLMESISGLEMASQSTDFRLFDRKVVEVFKTITERERMFRGIIDWMGFKKAYVSFAADARQEGASAYSYRKLFRMAINSITAFSLFPLRITGYLGVAITLSSGLLLLRMMFARFYSNPNLFSPLAIVLVINTLLIGVVLMAVGLVALYIGTIHTEVVNRPLYIVRERVNFGEVIASDRRERSNLT